MGQMNVEKSVMINRPKQEVYDYLKYVKNQEKFSVWNMADPHKETTHQGTDATEGFIYSWSSKNKNVGTGSQEIKKLADGERIEYELRFERPMKNVANAHFSLEYMDENQTKVTWNFNGPTRFPMSLFKGIFQKMLGKDMAQSLENLKGVMER